MKYFLALFAHPYNAPPDARPTLVATDKAGNTREMRLTYELKNVKYKKSTIALSENFLQNKIASLIEDVAARQGTPHDAPALSQVPLLAEDHAPSALLFPAGALDQDLQQVDLSHHHGGLLAGQGGIFADPCVDLQDGAVDGRPDGQAFQQ